MYILKNTFKYLKIHVLNDIQGVHKKYTDNTYYK